MALVLSAHTCRVQFGVYSVGGCGPSTGSYLSDPGWWGRRGAERRIGAGMLGDHTVMKQCQSGTCVLAYRLIAACQTWKSAMLFELGCYLTLD